jgi:hypothetical protein
MRLSDAILLGDSLKTATNEYFIDLRDPANCRGCALGGALLATGFTKDEFMDYLVSESIRKRWPWVGTLERMNISRQYGKVMRGKRTLEQLCDYVRSVEPEEAGSGACGVHHGTSLLCWARVP